MAEERSNTSPDGTAVHVTAKSGNLDRGVDTILEALLGETHEGLLNNLVGEGLGVVHIAELRGNLSERGGLGVGQVVVVQKTGIRLLHKFAGWGVESHVVKAVKVSLARLAVGVAVDSLLGLTTAVIAVGSIESLGVASEGVVAIDVRVLAGKIGLVEIVNVLHVGTTQSRLNNDGGVGANKHSNGTSTTSRTSITLGVEGNITGNDDSVTAVPSGRLNPVDGVEESVGTTIASVDGVNTLEVGVVAEKLHQNSLDGLGLVEDGLSTNLNTTDGVGVDVVVLKKTGSNSQGKGVDICNCESGHCSPQKK